MEQKGDQLDRETFSCSICLDLLKDPVTIPCGHSYCMSCIKSYWDVDETKSCHCPQCRQAFMPRPVLGKNTMLPVIVEQLKKTGLQATPDDHCYAGPEDVTCDVCTGRKLKAIKSCLVCLASFCEKHLQPHYGSAPLKKHKLVEPSKNLQENICSHHDEVMKMFCRTDQQCVCILCLMEDHKGHDTVSVVTERAEKQKELEVRREETQQGIQDREKDVKLLQPEKKSISLSADKAVEDSEKTVTEMICFIQKNSSEVKQQIRSQQEAELSRINELQEKLEQEIIDMRRKDAELKKVSDMEDHNQFLRSYPSVSVFSGSTYSSFFVRPLRYFEDVKSAVSELRVTLEDMLKDNRTNISVAVTEVDVLLSEPEPKSRAGMLKLFSEITLDPDTAHRHLSLSEGNRNITTVYGGEFSFDYQNKFREWCQVLSRESLTGRCYWEVKWSGIQVYIAVTYKNISRTGDESRFGWNDKSWALDCTRDGYVFWYNNIKTSISGPRSSRVGVYLDHKERLLSFFSISETKTLLHRVQTTFTQPLHAGVYLSTFDYGYSLEFCKVK